MQMCFSKMNHTALAEMIKRIIRLFMSPFALLVFVFGFKVIKVKSDRVGHLVAEMFGALNDSDLRTPANKIIFVLKKNRISNRAFIEMVHSEYNCQIVELPLLLFKVLQLPHFVMPDERKYCTSESQPNRIYSIFASEATFFQKEMLPAKCREKLLDFKLRKGIDPNLKIAVLHLRASLAETEHWQRNVDPNNFRSAFQYLTKNGYYVVRIGDHAGGVDFIDNDKFGCFRETDDEYDYLDLALCAYGDIFIGSSSGPVLLAAIFGTPVVSFNLALPFCFSPTGSWNQIGIPKIIRDKATKKTVSLRDVYKLNLDQIRSSTNDGFLKYELVDNSEEDIFETLLEFITFTEEKSYLKVETKDFQEKVKALNKGRHIDEGSLSMPGKWFCKKHYGISE